MQREAQPPTAPPAAAPAAPAAPAAVAETRDKIVHDAYMAVEAHFSGKTSRETYLHTIINQLERYEKQTDDPSIAKKLAEYAVDFKDLLKLVVRTDFQATNEFSVLGVKSSRHSNAFFATAMQMLEAELEYTVKISTIRAEIAEHLDMLARRVAEGATADELQAVHTHLGTNISDFTAPNEEARDLLRKKVTGTVRSFFENISHKISFEAGEYKGGRGRYSRELKPFLTRALNVRDYESLKPTDLPTHASDWLDLALAYDREREWVVNAIAFDTLERSMLTAEDPVQVADLRRLKKRHFESAPELVRFFISAPESFDDDASDSTTHAIFKRTRAEEDNVRICRVRL
jgi:hypothetical protein